MAREAPVCVLLRRGPSEWTQLIRWNTQNDEIQCGHWFKGRVYEHRCDVSPNGKWFLYFVNKINAQTLEDTDGYTYAWSAVSQPPFFKAELLWPKGDCWHGGGYFESNREIFLNHHPDVAVPHPQHRSSRFTITPNPKAHGEDDPIHSMRISKAGWELIRRGNFPYGGLNAGWVTEQTEVWEKPGRDGKRLRRELLGIDFEAYGGPYMEKFSLISKAGESLKLPEACAVMVFT